MTTAYLVVCAWYSWSVISFQSYFDILNEGSVLGLFLFSAMISALMLLLLLLFTQVSEKYRAMNNESSDENDEIDYNCYIHPPERPLDYISEVDRLDVGEEYSVDKEETVQWLLITGRFLVGWAWANFISLSITKLMTYIVSNSNKNVVWLNTLEKILLSILVFIIGALLESNSSRRHE
jgi:hypothetical protein